MRQNTSRNPGRTQTDLDLERWGTMSNLPPEGRAAFLYVAETIGCHTAAQHIRDDRRRRGLVQAAPAPEPRPGPKLKATAPRGPMLMVVPEGPDAGVAPDPDGAWWDDVLRVADRHAPGELNSRSRGVLDAVRRAALAHLR